MAEFDAPAQAHAAGRSPHQPGDAPAPRIAYVLPTRNRLARLSETLRALGALPPHEAEVVVVDNASDPPAACPRALDNGLEVRVIRRAVNEGAAARNTGAEAVDPACEWIVMLDDDSHPRDVGWLARLGAMPGDVAAVSADIHLPARGCREQGGLPEVFIGCGVAIRREALLCAGGYDPGFGYYAEEYDLAARLLAAGARIAFEPSFAIDHHKVDQGRDMDLILGRLVRNNGWVIQRHAPEAVRRADLRRMRARYRRIAEKEDAVEGVGLGLVELRRTLGRQRRTPMPEAIWDRFTGLAHAREALGRAHAARPFGSAALVEPGKNGEVVRRALEELGVREASSDEAEALVVGTMSPGPMLDAGERWGPEASDGRPVLMPWRPGMLVPSDPIRSVAEAARAGGASPARRAA